MGCHIIQCMPGYEERWRHKMVAKTAVRLRRTGMDKSPESVVFRRSLVILSWAVSVLRWGQRPNWSHITADLRGDETEPEVREGWIRR